MTQASPPQGPGATLMRVRYASPALLRRLADEQVRRGSLFVATTEMRMVGDPIELHLSVAGLEGSVRLVGVVALPTPDDPATGLRIDVNDVEDVLGDIESFLLLAGAMLPDNAVQLGASRIKVRLRFDGAEDFRDLFEREIRRSEMFLFAEEPKPPGSQVELSLVIPEHARTFILLGEVSHTIYPDGDAEETPGMAVRLTNLTPAVLHELESFIAEALAPPAPSPQPPAPAFAIPPAPNLELSELTDGLDFEPAAQDDGPRRPSSFDWPLAPATPSQPVPVVPAPAAQAPTTQAPTAQAPTTHAPVVQPDASAREEGESLIDEASADFALAGLEDSPPMTAPRAAPSDEPRAPEPAPPAAAPDEATPAFLANLAEAAISAPPAVDAQAAFLATSAAPVFAEPALDAGPPPAVAYDGSVADAGWSDAVPLAPPVEPQSPPSEQPDFSFDVDWGPQARTTAPIAERAYAGFAEPEPEAPPEEAADPLLLSPLDEISFAGDRRGGGRLPARVEVKLRPTDLRQFRELYTKDISRGGVFVYSDSPPPIGTQVEVLLYVPGAVEPFSFLGSVIHIVGAHDLRGPADLPGMGIRFEHIQDEARVAIESIISRVTDAVPVSQPVPPTLAESPLHLAAPSTVSGAAVQPALAPPQPLPIGYPQVIQGVAHYPVIQASPGGPLIQVVPAVPLDPAWQGAAGLAPGVVAPAVVAPAVGAPGYPSPGPYVIQPAQTAFFSPGQSPQLGYPVVPPAPAPIAAPTPAPPPAAPHPAPPTVPMSAAAEPVAPAAVSRSLSVEKRPHPREPQKWQLVLRYFTMSEFRDAYRKDIARGGAFLPTDENFELRSMIDVVVIPPGTTRGVTLRSEVVHAVPAEPGRPGTGGIGVQFTDLNAKKKEAFEAYIGGSGEGVLPEEEEPAETRRDGRKAQRRGGGRPVVLSASPDRRAAAERKMALPPPPTVQRLSPPSGWGAQDRTAAPKTPPVQREAPPPATPRPRVPARMEPAPPRGREPFPEPPPTFAAPPPRGPSLERRAPEPPAERWAPELPREPSFANRETFALGSEAFGAERPVEPPMFGAPPPSAREPLFSPAPPVAAPRFDEGPPSGAVWEDRFEASFGVVDLGEEAQDELLPPPPPPPPRAAPAPAVPSYAQKKAPSGNQDELDRLLDLEFADDPGQPIDFENIDVVFEGSGHHKKPASKAAAPAGTARPAAKARQANITAADAQELLAALESALRRSYYDALGVKPNAPRAQIDEAIETRIAPFRENGYGALDPSVMRILGSGRERLERVAATLRDPESRASYECTAGILLDLEEYEVGPERDARMKVRAQFRERFAQEYPDKVRKAEDYFRAALDELRGGRKQAALEFVKLALAYFPLSDRYLELMRKIQPR